MKFFFTVMFLSSLLFSIAAAEDNPKLHRPPAQSVIEQSPPLFRSPPGGFEIVNPAEFCKAQGMLLPWPGWSNQLIGDVAYAVADRHLVFMVVRNAATESVAHSYLTGQGVNMANIRYIHDSHISTSSMWIRDYGPFCIYEDGIEAITDFRYGTYPNDDGVPETIATYFDHPYYHTNLIHHGGNHITDGNGMGFVSTNIWNHNPGYSESQIRGVFRDYLGVDSLLVYEPIGGDLTGHIDMFCKLLNDSLFIVGEYGWQDLCYPGDDVMLDELAADLSSLNNLDGRPFTVARMPMGPWDPDGPYCAINRTHTNSLILNDKVLVPVYGFASDAEALTIYETLMPGYEIIGIDSENIIPYAGAIHCVTNTIHAANPLIVLHQPLHILPAGTAPEVSFTINPRFENTEASVFYRLESEMDFTEAAATRSLGVWSVSLPAMAADFCYYIAGQAVSGTTTLPVWLPEQAPAAFFEVDVIDDVAVDEMIEPRMILTCYPNPFNPMTTIRYGIPEHSAVNLRIFNVSGQLVRTLLQDESHSDGIFAIPWDGRDSYGQQMPTGTYFCRLETDDLVTTQRMTLVR